MVGRHIQFAFLFRVKRAQTRDKLQIPKSFLTEIGVNPFAVFGAVARQDRQNIKFRPVPLQSFGGGQYPIKGILTRRLFSEFIALKIAVKAQPDKKFVFCKEFCKIIVDLRSVGLNRIDNTAVFAVELFRRLNKMLKKRQTAEIRLSTLKGECNGLPVGKFKSLFDKNIRCLRRHHAEAEMLTVLGNIQIKAVFA